MELHEGRREEKGSSFCLIYYLQLPLASDDSLEEERKETNNKQREAEGKEGRKEGRKGGKKRGGKGQHVKVKLL
jgi:hypothetical protein